MSNSTDHENLSTFAATINSRLSAEARVASAIGFGWLCGGIATFVLMTGTGVACAFYGYSYMVSIKPAAEQTAKSLAAALERSNLQTTVSGTLSLSAGSQLRLAPDQTVKLADGAVVSLDPRSTVRVVGDVKVEVPQPSQQQLQIDTKSRSEDLPFTDYTIFRGVNFGAGEVVTGWHYSLADTTRPNFQYCYFMQKVEKGLGIKYIIAIDGAVRKQTGTNKLSSFNLDEATSNCMWFSGA